MLTRRGFLATILGSVAAAGLPPVPEWIWAPTLEAPPVSPAALLTVEQILQVFAGKVETYLVRPLRHLPQFKVDVVELSHKQRRRYEFCGPTGHQVIENITLPLIVTHDGPTLDRLDYQARHFAAKLKNARLTFPLPALGNELKEGQYLSSSGLALRGVVYPDPKLFSLPDDQFVLRVDARVS